MTTPRESVRAAFVAILEAANLGVTIYDRLPFEGADRNSVVLAIVSGTSKSPGVGLRKDAPKRGLMMMYRIQIDVNNSDKTACGVLADAVEQAIMDAADTLRSTYDIHNVRKMLDVDALPFGDQISRIILQLFPPLSLSQTFVAGLKRDQWFKEELGLRKAQS